MPVSGWFSHDLPTSVLCNVDNNWTEEWELLWSKWNKQICNLIKKNEDKIRGSFMVSPPSNANIFRINCHIPFLAQKERLLCVQLEDGAQKLLSVSGALVRGKAIHSLNQKVIFWSLLWRPALQIAQSVMSLRSTISLTGAYSLTLSSYQTLYWSLKFGGEWPNIIHAGHCAFTW